MPDPILDPGVALHFSRQGARGSWVCAHLCAWPLPFQGSLCATSHLLQWKRQQIRQSAISSICIGGTHGSTRPYEKAHGYRVWNRSVRSPQELLGSEGKHWASLALVCAPRDGFGVWRGKGSTCSEIRSEPVLQECFYFASQGHSRSAPSAVTGKGLCLVNLPGAEGNGLAYACIATWAHGS